MRTHYTTIKLPEGLVKKVDTYIEKNPDSGYINSTDFIRVAVREKLERK